jgi:tripartite ATP-independent transporter DctP family solute receptor
MFKTARMAFGLLLAAGFIAGCDSQTSTRTSTTQSTARSSRAQETPAPAEEPKAPKAEAKVIRAGVAMDERSSQYKGLLHFKELVESESQGRLKVEIFTNLRLGDDTETEMVAKLRDGTLEMTCISTTSLAGLDKRWMIFDLPFLFSSEDTADQVLDGLLGKTYLDSLVTHDIIGMAFWENGFSDLTNNVRFIKSPDHLKGLKIGTTGSPVHQATFKAMKAKPAPLPFDQRFPALAQKIIDGQGSPPTASLLQKFHEVQGYVTLTHHFYSPFVFMYGRRLWDTLAREDQDIIYRVAQEAGRYQRRINREAVKEALADLSKAGMAVTELGSAQREAFVKATGNVAKQFEADFGADNLKALKDEIAGKSNY